jgi:hypothetical protein
MKKLCVLLASGGFVFQFGIGACIELSNYLNPCGTILAICTQQDLDNLNHTIPDFNYDPSCTIPGECGALPFENFSGGLFGSGPGVRPQGPPP